MKNKILSIIMAGALMTSLTGCIDEVVPQTNVATVDQVSSAPGAYDNAVSAITSTLCGTFPLFGSGNNRPNDLGMPALMLERDMMGQDIAYPYINWYSYWYCGNYLGPSYYICQLPWSYYFKWIKSCNEVINLAGEEPEESMRAGKGIAYAMRALFYLEMARLYAPKPYSKDKTAPTVPYVAETTQINDLAKNPRATNEEMYAYILSDLDKAEDLLSGYERKDKTTPDQSVVYGLKARTYLDMEDWANARKYAKLAQAGYKIMTDEEYTSWETGFNTPNDSWMLCMQYKSDDPQILLNDADSSWGSMMCIEINPYVSGCGYAANYGMPFPIDYHLYQTIPATDFRKKCFIDFAIDEMDEASALVALTAYTKHPDWMLETAAAAQGNGYNYGVGGLPLKFRTAGGEAGRDNQYVGFVVAVPMMRVEEMYLIEAEAAGMQNEQEGIQLLTTFAKTRDANYVYGTHNEAYGNTSTPAFQNEVWWQRRVELWGEGFATFDIKRLQKGIIRSYAGTNHTDLYRYNTDTTPEWMNYCINQTETNYNTECTNNPDPSVTPGNSPEYVW